MTDLRQFTNYSGYYARLANQHVLEDRPSMGIHNRNTRWEHLTQVIENLELQTDFYVHPILATDWRIFEYSTLKPQQYKHQSLTLAYYQICQTAVFSQQSQFVIVEDDLTITNLRKFLELIMFEPEDLHLCYLSLTKHNQESAYTEPHNHLWFKKTNMGRKF